MIRPILIAQGMRDVRVVPAESEQMVAALKQRGVPVTYVTFSDEGHGFVGRKTGWPSTRSPRHSSPSISAAASSRSARLPAPQSRSRPAATWYPDCGVDRTIRHCAAVCIERGRRACVGRAAACRKTGIAASLKTSSETLAPALP